MKTVISFNININCEKAYSTSITTSPINVVTDSDVNKSNIYDCCSGKNNSAGKHPITKEPLKWMYYDDYKKKYLKEAAS